MVRKALVAASFLITSLSVTSLSAQDLSSLEALIPMQQQQASGAYSALPEDQFIADMNQPTPFTQAEEIYRISAGDTIALSFVFMEDYVSSGDFTDANSVGQEAINTSLGPIDNIRSEMLATAPISSNQRAYMLNLINQIAQKNPFRVNSGGFINITGIDPILLSGLTVQEAAYRMRLLPEFSGLLVNVTKLPFEENTRGNLSLFGASMFDLDDNQVVVASNNSGMLPASYQINPGDVIRLQL
jgi:protein involved in polysaccharide export with SLBB domain